MEEKLASQLEMRRKLFDGVSLEFLGPESEEELLYEDPVNRYAAGMLFPQGYESRSENIAAEELLETDKQEDVVSSADAEGSAGDPDEGAVSMANSFYPSVMGLSFYCSGANPKLLVRVSTALYRRAEIGEIFVETGDLPKELLESDDFKENFRYSEGKTYCLGSIDAALIKSFEEALKDNSQLKDALYRLKRLSQGAWKRVPSHHEIIVDSKVDSTKISEGLTLICNRRTDAKRKATLFTIAVRNTFPACAGSDAAHVFFQNQVDVLSADPKKSNVFIEYERGEDITTEEEAKSLSLLYRHNKHFAVGHGCAVEWKKNDDDNTANRLTGKPMPFYEVPQVEFDLSATDSDFNKDILSMWHLSDIGANDPAELLKGLRAFCGSYEKWIGLREKEALQLKGHIEIAQKHIGLCREAYQRMLAGIDTLQSNPDAFLSFRLANRGMMIQGLQSEFQRRRMLQAEVEQEAIIWPDVNGEAAKNRRWRPFQLAFFLLSINGAVDAQSDDRSLVDLIWFPTGGGKTEAYLGLSAFVSFYRRLKYKEDGFGTAVVMRYTLRLLTSQQFQRACTLICAMEKMRNDDAALGLGDQPFNIGLWVGRDATPNTIKDAVKRFEEFRRSPYAKNPSPILACPWCGSLLTNEKPGRARGYGYKIKERPQRVILHCLEQECPFNEKLPVEFIDEQIYKNPTTILFGTVDKFAQLPWREGIASIFALDAGNTRRCPELIIQDELHLISGALGTMVALYETAIDFFCTNKGIRPKIIASTATARRSREQCSNLFNRDVRQFPQPALDARDSYFAREASLTSKPGRLYVGLMASGKTQTTAIIRLSAALLQVTQNAEVDDETKDKYWTLVSYFNSIRELGGYVSLLMDDIPAHQHNLWERNGGRMRNISMPVELTSRKKAEEIPEILNQLFVEYPNRGAADTLSATNMISVGVDVDRLNTMIVRGQPKTASEYIQASSRIGRKYPGLVFTLYNSARTRDRAHYERFVTFHESFYKYVEPSSITPFSAPARARALHAILVSMVRHATAFGGSGDAAKKFNVEDAGVDAIRKFIIERVRNIDGREEANTTDDIDRLFREWRQLVESHGEAVEFATLVEGRLLKVRDASVSKWEAPMSMRHVDAESCVECLDE